MTNIIWAPIRKGLENISLSANWMWPANNSGENARLYEAVKSVSDFAISLGVNIPTGKDSLSMTQKYPDGTKVLSPGTVIISAAAETSDIRKVIKPAAIKDFDSEFVFINFCEGTNLTGSSFYQTLSQIGNNVIQTKDPNSIIRYFKIIQEMIHNDEILSGHDISSGGFITSILEMNFPNSTHGMELNLNGFNEDDIVKILFNESPGIVIQIKKDGVKRLSKENVEFIKLGKLVEERKLKFLHNNKRIELDIDHFRDIWFKTSFLLDREQTNMDECKSRFLNYKNQKLKYKFPNSFTVKIKKGSYKKNIIAAVIREKGINSEREMAYMLHLSGFEVKDVHMTDLVSGKENLENVNMVVFPGGFSNSDVLGSAKGWAGAFKYNERAKKAINQFYSRSNTLSLGVCNGCQLMMELNLIDKKLNGNHPKMEHNNSKKFECTFSGIDILESNAVMLKNLSGSTLGIWSAHGEGKFNFKGADVNIVAKFHYDDYPGNPNGSEKSAAAIASNDGRHLAIMPHLERSIFPWNWGHYEPNRKDEVSPWILPFQNARKWLEENA